VYSWPHAAHAIHRLLCLSFSKHDAWACCSVRGHAHPVSKTEPAATRHTRQLAIKKTFLWAPFFSFFLAPFFLSFDWSLGLSAFLSFIGAASTTQKQKRKQKKQKKQKQKNKNKKNKKAKKQKNKKKRRRKRKQKKEKGPEKKGKKGPKKKDQKKEKTTGCQSSLVVVRNRTTNVCSARIKVRRSWEACPPPVFVVVTIPSRVATLCGCQARRPTHTL
jgi:outer membrane biosynthesis protein TonB